MGTAVINWDGSWTQDLTISATIDDGAQSRTAEYTISGKVYMEFSIVGTYAAGTYDKAAQAFILRKTQAGNFQERQNHHDSKPLNGGSGLSFNQVITVGPDVNDFVLEIDNASNLNLSSVRVDYKTAHVLTTA